MAAKRRRIVQRSCSSRFPFRCRCGRPSSKPQCHECLSEAAKENSSYGDGLHPGSEYSADEAQFMLACQAEKERLGVLKLSPREILAVARRLGYRKVIAVAEVA